MKKQPNALLGRPVLIDWPIRWKSEMGWREGEEAALKAEAQANRNNLYFGRTGEIVGYNPGSDDGKDLLVKLDSGELVSLYTGAVTVTGPAPDSNADVVNLLREIRDLLKK